MPLIGCVDTIADVGISGWAADDADPGGAVQVDVVVNSRVVATVPCEVFREDLLAAGIADGCKGFQFDPSAHLKPGLNKLEVRYAGSDLVVPKGTGRWIKRREGALSPWEVAFLAALEAYHEFKPDEDVCGIGEATGGLERALLEAEIPFRKFTRGEVLQDRAGAGPAEKADVVISWAWPSPAPDCISALKQVVQHRMNMSGLLAIGFIETAGISGPIRQAFEECGATRVRLESLTPAPDGERRVFAIAEAVRSEAKNPAPAPIVAHIHVPKCAGTSFRALLERHFGPRHLGLYVNDTYFVYGAEVLRSHLLQDPRIWGLSSHHVRVFPRWLAGREMLYVTFLRDPIEQFVSYMTHIKKHYLKITSPSLLEAVPPNAPQLTLREFARWLLTQERDIPFRENHNVSFFSRHSAPAAEDRLQAAKAALSEFFFVGITERMEESIVKLRTRVRNAGLEFPASPAPVENTSADYRDDVNWIHPDDEVGSLLLRSVEKDRQLYDWARARV